MKKKVTIYDVAEAADVSLATVSRVINGSNVVKPATRERVLKQLNDSISSLIRLQEVLQLVKLQLLQLYSHSHYLDM